MAVAVAAENTAETPEPSRWRRLGDAVFRPAQRRPLTPWTVLLALLAIGVGTLLGLGRTRGPGAWNTIWAEDGSILLGDALNKSAVETLTSSLNGYFITVPRLLAEPASWVPVKWAAVVLSGEAALAAALIAMLVYVAAGTHIHDPVLRAAVAIPVVVTPVGALFSPHHVVTLQFIMMYALFWVLLWEPARPAGRIVAAGFILLAALSTIIVVGLVPLAVYRLFARRTGYSVALLGALAAGLAVQFGGLLLGAASREGVTTPRPDPVWALIEYVRWAVPYSTLGQTWLEPGVANQNGFYPSYVFVRTMEHLALVGLAWCVVVVIVLLALRRVTNPDRVLAGVAAIHSVGLFMMSFMAGGPRTEGQYLVAEWFLLSSDRYLVAPGLLLIVTFVALLRPSGPLGRDLKAWPANAFPVLMYLTLLAVVCVANYRHDNPRSHSMPWTKAVAQAAAQCRADPARTEVVAAVGSQMWGNRWPQITLPCDRLR